MVNHTVKLISNGTMAYKSHTKWHTELGIKKTKKHDINVK